MQLLYLSTHVIRAVLADSVGDPVSGADVVLTIVNKVTGVEIAGDSWPADMTESSTAGTYEYLEPDDVVNALTDKVRYSAQVLAITGSGMRYAEELIVVRTDND